MKTLLTLILALSLASQIRTSAQTGDFTLSTNHETIIINSGETATFTISFAIQNGFDASIFLKLISEGQSMQSGGGILSAAFVNAPYNDITLKVTSTASLTKAGHYAFRIIGSNASHTSSVNCSVNVVRPPSNWRIMPQNAGGYVPTFVVQDESGYYWYDVPNSNGVKKVNKNSSLESWMSQPQMSFEATDITPVFDRLHNRMWMKSRNNELLSYNLSTNNATIHTYNGVSPSPIYSISIDNTTGALWIGSLNKIYRLVGTEWTVFDSTNSFVGHIPTTLVCDDSILWTGTINGLIKYNGATWTRYDLPDFGIGTAAIGVMAAEPNGNIWVNLVSPLSNDYPFDYTSYGLAKFDGTTWTLYNHSNSPMSEDNVVFSMAIDKRGNKWMATGAECGLHGDVKGGAGILKFDNTTWTAYTKENSPLPDNYITWVGVDNDDNVWFHRYTQCDSKALSFWGVFNENGLPPFLAPPTGVEEQPEATDGITIYPNPTNTTFTISGADNILSVKLMNSLGMEISRKSLVVSGKVEMDVADLASGVYFVQMRTSTGMITKSIVVSR